MAENPSSFLRQRTATHSSFTRQRTATHSSFTRQRTATHSSFTRQRTATLFLHPAENRNTLPYPAENRYPFSPLPGEGREPDTMLTYSTRKLPEMMGRDLEKIRRSSLLGNLTLLQVILSLTLLEVFSSSFLSDCPEIEPVFLPPAENRNTLFLHPAENRNTLFLHPAENRNTLFLHPAENRNTLPYPAENRYPFSPLPGEGREPDTMLTYSTRKLPEMMGRDLEKIRRSSLLGNLTLLQVILSLTLLEVFSSSFLSDCPEIEPVFLPPAENRNTLFLHPAENRNTLFLHPAENRNTLFLHPAENRNTLPYPAENRYPFSPLPGEGREPDTMLTYSTRKLPEMMGRDLEKIRRSSLLGNLRPSLDSIRKFFFNLKLNGEVSITLLDSLHILIKLANDLDYCKVFCHRSYLVFNCYMKLTKWSPSLDVSVESSVIPIWVTFPLLRPHLYTPRILHGLGALFGKPLKIDAATSTTGKPAFTGGAYTPEMHFFATEIIISVVFSTALHLKPSTQEK
ncbi:hypothetical protein M5K25_005294 [Dendrobium thyrsiflorum]|uniref:DUF4283 domain-containing protein n=1 Tax=Dendrobium thyrsiflorum TaxID=117978 RepID=A0ABD0VPQ3_DENTH